jgi:hypothetical protein
VIFCFLAIGVALFCCWFASAGQEPPGNSIDDEWRWFQQVDPIVPRGPSSDCEKELELV